MNAVRAYYKTDVKTRSLKKVFSKTYGCFSIQKLQELTWHDVIISDSGGVHKSRCLGTKFIYLKTW